MTKQNKPAQKDNAQTKEPKKSSQESKNPARKKCC